MSGPIIRSGASPEFSKNWDKIFGGGKKPAGKTASQPPKKAVAAATPKAKAAKKAAPKASPKKKK